jgi:hypothetical protein
MTTIEKKIPHTIGKEKALEKIRQLADQIRESYGYLVKNLTEEWNDAGCEFGFDFKIFMYTAHIDGEIVVKKDHVLITAEGPDAISMFKGQAEEVLADEGEKFLRG